MAAINMTITFNVRIAWWLHWYLIGVVQMARITGCEPDEVKVKHWIGKAIKIDHIK